MIKQGATPVYYVARDALVAKRRAGFRPSLERTSRPVADEEWRIDEQKHEWVARAQALDDEMARRRALYLERVELLEDPELPLPLRKHLSETHRHDMNLDLLVFSFVKCFDGALDDGHEEHFYMEREWRVLYNVQFRVDDVIRVIVPESYLAKLRRDLPEFAGGVVTVPD